MSLSLSVKFSPHSVTADQVQEVVAACGKQAFKGQLTGYAVRNDQGRVDWLLQYNSSDPKKEGIVYALVTFRLNAQGHTLGFTIGTRTSAFNKWIIIHLMNEIALRLNGILRSERHEPSAPDPISPSLSVFLEDIAAHAPHHMLEQEAGVFPPEFALKDYWIHVPSTSSVPAPRLDGLEAGEGGQTPDEKEPLVPSGLLNPDA